MSEFDAWVKSVSEGEISVHPGGGMLLARKVLQMQQEMEKALEVIRTVRDHSETANRFIENYDRNHAK